METANPDAPGRGARHGPFRPSYPTRREGTGPDPWYRASGSVFLRVRPANAAVATRQRVSSARLERSKPLTGACLARYTAPQS
jgi:hypothetical protein